MVSDNAKNWHTLDSEIGLNTTHYTNHSLGVSLYNGTVSYQFRNNINNTSKMFINENNLSKKDNPDDSNGRIILKTTATVIL